MSEAVAYGPDTEHVRALLRAAVALDVEKWQDLTRAHLGSREVAHAQDRVRALMGWGTVWTPEAAADGSIDPPPHGALFAAFQAGYRTNSHGSPVVAWTALALAGRHVLPAQVYGALTEPWAAAVGRVHPDDVRTVEDGMWPGGRTGAPVPVGRA